jgi:hypothetical protein
MYTNEAYIKEYLILLLTGISNSDGSAVTHSMEKLDALLQEQGNTLHPQLKHFMQNRSYAKALAYLGGEIPAKGTCAPKHKVV